MDSYPTFRGRPVSIYLSSSNQTMHSLSQMGKFTALLRHLLVVLPLLHLLQSADARSENMSNPLANVNLSPFSQWRSAYECLTKYKMPSPCPDKYVLKMDGILDVNQTDVASYCKLGGCADHTKEVLRCVHQVKRDFWFANKAPVSVLNNTISTGCATNSTISTANYTSSAIKLGFPAWSTSFLSVTIFTMLLNL